MRYIVGIFLLFFISLNTFADNASGVINLYKSPDPTSQIIQQMPEGTQVKVIASNMHKGFILVQTNDGQQGWVPANDVNDKPNTSTTNQPTNNQPTNNTQQIINQVKSQGTDAVKYLINKSPDVVKDSQTYATQLGKHYKHYLIDNVQHQELFVLGAVVLAIGIMMGLFIGRLIWGRSKHPYIR